VKKNLPYFEDESKLIEADTDLEALKTVMLSSIGWENRLPESHVKQLRDGFGKYASFKKNHQINLATIDQEICGKITVDMESYKKNVIVQLTYIDNLISQEDLKKNVDEYLSKLTPDQILVFSKNVTGYRYRQLTKNIYLKFTNEKSPKITISTCYFTASIPGCIIKSKNGLIKVLDYLCNPEELLSDNL